MKKRNFKYYISVFALFVVALSFYACAPKGTLTFNDQQITMGVNQELELKDLVTIKGVSIENITFESSAPNVVAVTPRKTIVAGANEGFAMLTAKGYNGFLEIVVKGVANEFSSPQNVHFNQTTGCVEWDNVYSADVVANNFKLLISRDGEQGSEIVVNKNYYKLEDYGKFEVSVACMERSGVKASNYSEPYSFTKLSAPYNLKYNSNTNSLTWQTNSDVTAYYIKKDGVLSEMLTNKNYLQELKEEKTYKISVISASATFEENVFGSESEELTLTRLKTPNLSMQNGLLTWTDQQEGVSGYFVSVYQLINDSFELLTEQNIKYNGKNYSYKPTLNSGVYKIEVQCLGDGENYVDFDSSKHYINSAQVSSGELYKLEKQTLLFNKDKSEFSVLNFNPADGLNLELNVYYNDQILSQIDMSSNGKCVYNFNNAGHYSFTLVNKAKSVQQIDSFSDEITVIKLGEISSAFQSVDGAGNYTINNLVLNYANHFVVEKAFDGITTPLVNIGDNKYGLANEIFDSQGEYQIFITASGDDYTNNYILSSQTTLTVKRLKTVVLADDKDYGKIVWDSVGEDSGIIYKYEITGATTDKGSTTNTYYNYNTLPAGAYSIKVYSSSTTTGDGKTLILDAFNYASKDFAVSKQLTSPTLTVTRSETGYNLNITPVSNANRYCIQVNSNDPIYENHDVATALVVKLDNYLGTGEGVNGQTFYISVEAICTYSDYYTNSIKSELSLEKIPVATSFNVSANEVISTEMPYSHILNYQVFVNEVETNTLSKDVEDFEVKIKYISDLQKDGNCYYLDSDYAKFKLVRTTVSVKVNGLTVLWQASETSQKFTATLSFTQTPYVYSKEITNMNNITLGLINLEDIGFDMFKGINGMVECKFDAFSGKIAGSYKNGKFESGQDGVLSQYYVGNKTNNLLLKYADTGIGVVVQENLDKLNVTWQGLANTTYDFYDGINEHDNLNEYNVELNAGDYASTKKYTMSLTQTTQDLQKIYVFFVTRLRPVESLMVDINETITAKS